MSSDNQWKLEEALGLVRSLQPHTRRFGYHLTLGGGVLNKGKSEKDLDLFFLPLNPVGGKTPDGWSKEALPEKLMEWLGELWGPHQPLLGPGSEYANDLPSHFSMRDAGTDGIVNSGQLDTNRGVTAVEARNIEVPSGRQRQFFTGVRESDGALLWWGGATGRARWHLMGTEGSAPPPPSVYKATGKFSYSDMRIDVFVL